MSGHAGRVSRSGLGMADEFAKIKEMLLGGGAFRQVNLAPLGDKIWGGHGSVVNSASFIPSGMAGVCARKLSASIPGRGSAFGSITNSLKSGGLAASLK